MRLSGEALSEPRVMDCKYQRWGTPELDLSGAPDGTVHFTLELLDPDGSSRGILETGLIKDTTAPSVTISTSGEDIPVNGGVRDFTLQYSEPVTIALTVARVHVTTTGTASCSPSIAGSNDRSAVVRLSSCKGFGTVALSVDEGSAVDAAGNAAGAGSLSVVSRVLSPLPKNPSSWASFLERGDASPEQKSEIIARLAEADSATQSFLAQDLTLSAEQVAALADALKATGPSAEALTMLARLALHPRIGAIPIPYGAFAAGDLVIVQAAPGIPATQYSAYVNALAQIASEGAYLRGDAVPSSALSGWIADASLTPLRYQALAYLCHELAIGAVTGAIASVSSAYGCIFDLARDASLNSGVALDFSYLDFNAGTAPVIVSDSALGEFKWAGSKATHLDLSHRDFLAGCALTPCYLDFSGADLSGTSFSASSLIGSNLALSKLVSVDFSGADLRAVDFRGAIGFPRTTFAGAMSAVGAKLDGMNLSGLSLGSLFTSAQATQLEAMDYATPTSLMESDLSGADLTTAYLAQSDLTSAKLDGAILHGAVLDQASGVSGETLRKAADVTAVSVASLSFANEDLRGVNLSGVQARGADFSGANLANANLSSGDFVGASLSNIDLSKANLLGAVFGDRNSELAGASFSGSILRGRNFSGMDLSGVSFVGADLTSSNLSGAYLSGSVLSSAVEPADFTGAILTGATLSGATVGDSAFGRRIIRLLGADLRSTNLTGLDLSDADLTGADLTGATASGARLDRVVLQDALGDFSRILASALSYVGASLAGLDLSGTSFAGKDISTVSLDLSNLSGVNLTGATLPSSILLGFDSDGNELRFEYDSGLSAADNLNVFRVTLGSVDPSSSHLKASGTTRWIDGSAF